MSYTFTCPKCGFQEEDEFGDPMGGDETCPKCGAGRAAVLPAAAKNRTPPERVPVMATAGAPTLPVAASTLPPPPPSVPGYELLEEIGRGGMGVVYKAREEQLDRVVALKMILAGAHAGRTELGRFESEMHAVAQLQHENIVRIYHSGSHEGRPFCAMEFLDGGSLAEKLGGKPVGARRAAELIEALARAMHHAHRRGFIHRDLKPANILIDEHGTAKITDFGLARKFGEAAAARYTATGNVVGTPAYMAPEQAKGSDKDLGPATDVYALGAILYELLTGTPPFQADSPMDTMLQVVHEEPLPPGRLARVPRDQETVCLKCLEKAPRRRYGSAEALADDLRRFLEGRPIQARPVGRWERAWKWARRRPTAAALLATVPLAVVALLVVSLGYNVALQTALASKEKHARDAEEQRDIANGALQEEAKQRQRAEEQEAVAKKERDLAEAARKAEKTQRERAEEQEKLAQRQRQRAEHFLTLTRTAMDEVLTEMSEEWLADAPYMTPVRRNLLAKARELRAELLKEEAGDPYVRLELGQASRRVGDIYRTMGSHKEAAEAYDESVGELGGLADEYRDRPEYRRQLALSLHQQGLLWLDRSDLPRARDALHGARRIQEGLPETPEHQAELARTLNRLAQALRYADQLPEAETVCRQALGLQGRLVQAAPAAADFRSDLAGTRTELGNVLVAQARKTGPDAARLFDLAEAEYQEAVKLGKELVEKQPRKTTYAWRLAAFYNNLGMAQQEAGALRIDKYSEAQKSYEEALRRRQQLTADYPDVPLYQQELSNTLSNLASVHKALQHLLAAEKFFERAVQTQENVVDYLRQHGGVRNLPAYENELARTLDNFALLLTAQVKAEKANERLNKAAGYHKTALGADPGRPLFRHSYCNHYAVRVEALLSKQDYDGAAKVAEELARAFADGWDGQQRAALLLSRCAHVAHNKARRYAEAKRYALRAVELLREAVKNGYRDSRFLRESPALEPLRELTGVKEPFEKLVSELR